MDEITVFTGIRGTRILAAALAKLLLRKRGVVSKLDGRTVAANYKRRQNFGRPWSATEAAHARAMRLRGKSSEEIGIALNRTANAIDRHIGYQPKRSAA